MPSTPYHQLKQYINNNMRVDEQQAEAFCKKFRHKTVKRNEVLLRVDEVCPYIYFVNSGCLRVYMLDVNGKESTRFLITEGRFGTAFPSFNLQEPSLAAIQSIEAGEILYICHHDFNDLLANFPGWEHTYRIGLEKDYIASIKRIESLITMDARQRYQLLMETSPALIQRLPSKIIADYLGISQETLSRLKSKK
ncbi:Crp/Fnr family transcriptional regulator [Mucilaginibacter sp. 14171R-50]|uniref:Crp/Fnr family transcriptional regulator n=1 Tax=Mucilaginibacter sp. 14171R-50 TaxID=2703789 RepID=UPI00138CA8B1|nr:Crp/Fnr family transcriptional regulator [Mucilaginibacter sp. 14171R-50]QHS56746.1 Crp/Fnr family transcriptional regulator [Mucilaginibacter sp. 14171R-50]